MAMADPVPYFAASAISAWWTFPLWKAAAVGQSGFELQAKSPLWRYVEAVKPPWTGSFAVIGGMTWARAAIFFGSDEGAKKMKAYGCGTAIYTMLPPLVISVFVQCTNQPFVRSSIMLQDPQCKLAQGATFPNLSVIGHLARTKGLQSLWVGTTAGILKTAPKYMTAIAIKDGMEKWLAPAPKGDKSATMLRTAKKSVAAGAAGAFLTNPLDVLRNEQFKTEEPMGKAFKRLCRDEGVRWFARGAEKNLIAVAVPIASTIFLTETIAQWRQGSNA